MRNLLLLFSLVLSSATFAQVTYLTDEFNIPAGNLLINNGWYAHSGSGTNSVQAVSPALSWGSYVLSNQGNAAGVTNTGEDVNKPFLSFPNTGVVYASFMVRLNSPTSSTAGYFFHMGYYDSQTPNAGFTNLNTAHRARTYVQPGTNPSTQFQLGLAFNATTAQGYTADLNIGQTYLVVVKYEFVAGALNDIVSLFVFAEGDNAFAEPATPTLGPFTSTASAADAPSIQAVALRQYNATQNVIVDGIVVRDFWQLVPDCNGDIGGTAYLDGCDVCVGGNTGLEPCAVDCNGDLNGTAFLDNCNTCVGGNTGLSACVADCNGDFGGTAFLDNCSVCVGGNTDLTACLPDCNGDFGGTAYLDACNTCVAGNTGETPCPVTFLEDQFDYPAADPLTNHGWFAHSAAATNPILVHSAGLVFSDYLGSDIGNAGAVTNTGQDANKPFSTNANVGDVYASYLIRVDDPVVAASEGFFMHFGTYNNTENPTFTSLSTAFRGRVHIALGDEADKFKLGLSFNTAAASSTSADLNVGQTYLVVVKYQFIPGASNDNVSLYVFAQGDDFSMEPPVPTLGPLTATPTDPLDPLSPLAADAPVIQAIALRQYNAAQEVIVDGIIVRNVWDLFGACIPPAEPTNLACWETATLNEQTCEWEISGTQPTEPTNLACWETTSFNNTTCEWEISGTQPAEPTNLACWETTSFNNTTCEWEISGTQPTEPTNLACWETTSFNNTTCEWEISGTQPEEPTNLECWETASFNNTTCEWEVDGASVNTLYQEDFGGVHGWTLNVSTGANGATANAWFVNAEEGGGILPPNCGVANNGNNTLHISCTGFGCQPPFNILTGALYNAAQTTNSRAESPVFSTVGSSDITLGFNFISVGDGLLDNASVLYNDGSGWQVLNPSIKSSVCGGGQGQWTAFSATLPASCNNNPNVRIAINWTNNNDNIGTDPSIAIDNIVVTGLSGATQPAEPTNLACWETATFNNTTCEWEISGTQPEEPTNLACWETTSFNNTTCEWGISGTQPAEPTNLACWETTSFNNTTCEWEISGTQPTEPTNLACWETTSFNNTTCEWEISGTQPTEPTNLACWETTSFNNTTCEWEISGTQPEEPTNLACWEIASFNNTTCEWEIFGTQPIPAFAAVGPYCSGDIIPDLPTTSLNNFEGAWSPAINNTETTVYTFTPTEGQCAGTATLTITIQNCGGNGPINDEPCGAIEITSSGQTDLNTYAFLSTMTCNNQTGNNTNATPSLVGASCGGSNGRSMWYTFTTPSCDVNGMVPFEIEFSTNNTGTNFNTKLAIFGGNDNDCDGPLTELACNDDHQNVGNSMLCGPSGETTSTIVISTLQPNTQYWIYVDGFDAAFGDFVLSGRALTAPHGAIAVGSGTQIQLTTANVGAGLYTYYYKQVGSTGHATFNSPTALSDTRTLAPGNDYITQIMYRCGANFFDQSQWYRTEPQTITLEATCAIVNDMTCTFNGPNSYTLTWTQPSGSLYTDGGLSGYRIKRNPIGTTGVYTFGNPAVVCVDGTCSVTLPGNSPTGFNWTIETRCSANSVQVGNTSSCSPSGGLVLNPDLSNNTNKSAINDVFSFVNVEAGMEFVNVQMFDAYADFGLNTPMMGDYEIYVNDKNEIAWRRMDTPADFDFDFIIVPNPSNAMTTVHLNAVVEAGTFTIVDAMGRTINSGAISKTDNVNIDAAQLQSGVYMVVVTVGNQQLTRRLVVAK